MARAYLRLDPLLPEKKGRYPDGALATFVLVLCYAEFQPHRGLFRDRKLLAAMLRARRKWITYLIDHGDLRVLSDGSLYVDGWSEWQEGDVTVGERMRRLRARNRAAEPNGERASVTADVTVATVTEVPGDVTAPTVTHPKTEISALPRAVAVAKQGGGSGTVTIRAGTHAGQHGPECLVCHPPKQEPR